MGSSSSIGVAPPHDGDGGDLRDGDAYGQQPQQYADEGDGAAGGGGRYGEYGSYGDAGAAASGGGSPGAASSAGGATPLADTPHHLASIIGDDQGLLQRLGISPDIHDPLDLLFELISFLEPSAPFARPLQELISKVLLDSWTHIPDLNALRTWQRCTLLHAACQSRDKVCVCVRECVRVL